ncbi:membrane protein [Pontibacter sp. BAB1700]|uniref:Cysteine-rich secretory protein family protein n=2 Tax=Hymenobacteraceae TaxID=1853232 RepID=A0A1N6YI65_9BACT|nr:membrane protein [Pontibacter sp. BAB1700]SIR14315.1 Cysteine-rich secretory protein family protein [Pontibacter lucknowensis]
MNALDLLLTLIVLFSAYMGWRRGFAFSLLDLVRWVGTLILSFRLYPSLADWLSRATDWSVYWIPPISFFIIAVLSSMLIQFVGSLILDQFSDELHEHHVNKALGTMPGLMSGIITIAIISILLLSFPFPERFQTYVQESSIAGRFGTYTHLAEDELAPVFDRVVKRTLNKLTIAPESGQYIELPFTADDYQPKPALEARMLELLNQERIAMGLQPLQADTALTTVARRHAADMFTRGYFSHITPEGASAADRIRAANIPFRAAGENLALAPTLNIAHKGLMESPGHRANILHVRFGRVGIGVLQSRRHGLMITQKFRN